jgi:hypothetical protein
MVLKREWSGLESKARGEYRRRGFNMRFLHSFCDGFPQVLNIFFGSFLEISIGIKYGGFYIPAGPLQKQAGRDWGAPRIHGF